MPGHSKTDLSNVQLSTIAQLRINIIACQNEGAITDNLIYYQYAYIV
ncbi:hypothetical protein F0Z19_3859 [Vibrio cyclitrophicus]|nr:hypothetical protein F0Z19_3859 [Vibrio cyclitrophicus]